MEEIKKSVTQIYEHARRELGISRDDYALCAYGLYRAGDPRSKRPGWCCDPKEDVAYFIGISRPGLYKMLDRMVAHGLIEVDAASGFFRATGHFIDTQEGKKADVERKQSLQPSVNKVYSECKQSLQSSVNKVTPQHRGIVRVKEDKKEREEERVAAPPPAPVGETSASEAEKGAPPPVPPPPPNSGPADYSAPPDSMDWFVNAVEAANHDKAADDAGLEYPWENEPADYPAPPVAVTAFAPPEMVYETLPDGPTFRAEVHAPAERAVVVPKGKTAKPGVPQIVRDVVAYLNEKTGKAFKAETKGYDTGIVARQKEGATLEEMKRVIDNRVAAWGASDKMRDCLNPTTLFRPTNFANYLAESNAPKPVAASSSPAGQYNPRAAQPSSEPYRFPANYNPRA